MIARCDHLLLVWTVADNASNHDLALLYSELPVAIVLLQHWQLQTWTIFTYLLEYIHQSWHILICVVVHGRLTIFAPVRVHEEICPKLQLQTQSLYCIKSLHQTRGTEIWAVVYLSPSRQARDPFNMVNTVGRYVWSIIVCKISRGRAVKTSARFSPCIIYNNLR